MKIDTKITNKKDTTPNKLPPIFITRIPPKINMPPTKLVKMLTAIKQLKKD